MVVVGVEVGGVVGVVVSEVVAGVVVIGCDVAALDDCVVTGVIVTGVVTIVAVGFGPLLVDGTAVFIAGWCSGLVYDQYMTLPRGTVPGYCVGQRCG